MASTSSPAGTTGAPSHEISSRQLSMLLSRLKQNILHPSPEDERRLRTSQYERARVETNLGFAQSAFDRLERESGKRPDVLVDLAAQQETLEVLFDRLEDYKKLAMDFEDEGSSEEDLLGEIVPTPSESQESTKSLEEEQEPAPPSIQDLTETTTTQELRPRAAAAAVSPAAHTTARAALFANRRAQPVTQTTTATAEAILDQQRAEQEAILESIRRMAGTLKTNSQNFSASLESDKDRLDAAGASMEKTGLSMEAAKGRMGSLQRMSEGEGWWGRMMLYAWVYGLMLTLILLVFVFPKLRF